MELKKSFLSVPVVFFRFCVAFTALLIISGCGKKAPPTLKSFEKPAAAANLSAVHRENAVYLQWVFPKESESTVQKFLILRSSGSAFVKLAETESGARYFADTDIIPGTTYTYNIISRNHRGAHSSDSLFTVRPEASPPPPDVISFEVKDNYIRLTWQAVSTDARYNVYKAYEKGNYGMQPVNKTPLTSPTYTDNLNISRKVFYTVRSLTDSPVGNLSSPSPELQVDPLEFIPSELHGVHGIASHDRVYLSWNAPQESWITGFRVYKRTGGNSYKLAAETQLPAFIDNDPSPGKRDYRIHAVGPLLEGPGTEIIGLVVDPGM